MIGDCDGSSGAILRILMVRVGLLLIALVGVGPLVAQQPATPANAPTQRDAVLDAASAEIGRALFLRCLCANDALNYDAYGKLNSSVALKPIDWTLAGINVTKMTRIGANAIELDGVRVAIRFVSDRHEFERHPQKDVPVRVTIANTGDVAAFERALAAVFAIGIDRPLQKSMPEYWQHYLEPNRVWPQSSADILAGVTVYNVGPVPVPQQSGAQPNAGQANVPQAVGQVVTAPTATQKPVAEYTTYAGHDRIRGSVRVRLVVDSTGVPRRVSVAVPLGYGLDEKAVAAVRNLRFTPGMLNGQAVAVNYAFDVPFVMLPTPPGQ